MGIGAERLLVLIPVFVGFVGYACNLTISVHFTMDRILILALVDYHENSVIAMQNFGPKKPSHTRQKT